MKKIFLFFLVIAITLPTLAFASFDISLKYGSSGTAVVNLQNFLETQGLLKGKVDGKYGKATLSAVKTFQSENGLPADGSFGKMTRVKASAILATLAPSLNGKISAQNQTTTTPVIAPAVNSSASSVPLSGSLNLAQNSSYPSQSIIAPQTKFKLADFTLTNNTTEAVNLKKIEADLLINSVSNMANLYINNLYLTYGNNKTETLNAIAGSNYWPINLQLAVGQTLELSLYGDINSSISLNSTIGPSLLISGTSAVSMTNVYTNSDVVLPGQNTTIGTSSLTVGADSSTLPARSDVLKQNIVAGVFQFTANNDSYTISELKFIVPNSDIVSVVSDATLSDTATGSPIASKSLTPFFDGTNFVLDFNVNMPVPLNTSKSITLAYDLNKNISSLSTNKNIAPILAYVKADNSAGTSIDGSASNYGNFVSKYKGISLPVGGVTVNSLYAFKSIPTMTSIPLTNTTVLNDSNNNIYSFSVKADPDGSISVKQFTFTISLADPNGNPNLNDFTFFKGSADYTGSVNIGTILNNTFTSITSTEGIGAGITNTVVVSFPNEEVIGAGQTETFTLKAFVHNFHSSAVGNDSVSTSLSSDGSLVSGGSYLNTDFSKFYFGLSNTKATNATVSYYNLLWSDMSESSPEQHNNSNGSYTNDWYNGFGVLNLPLGSETINSQ